MLTLARNCRNEVCHVRLRQCLSISDETGLVPTFVSHNRIFGIFRLKSDCRDTACRVLLLALAFTHFLDTACRVPTVI